MLCISLLQPQNILLTAEPPSGDIKLCDFGFARRIHSGEDILDIVGTPDYVGEYCFSVTLYLFCYHLATVMVLELLSLSDNYGSCFDITW